MVRGFVSGAGVRHPVRWDGEMVFRAYRVPSRSGLCDHADAGRGNLLAPLQLC
ncbi:hypothetical protein HMPREF9588_02334 [Cutibacterium acnes HL025PA2]|nr:hypothetical protein HMPREF9588_02334 [Cutibacterium acnes HL025PA2]